MYEVRRGAGLCAALVLLACGAEARLAVGKPAPELSLPGLEGERFSSAGFKGKVVLVDFWATWCGPCRLELPEVEKVWRGLAAERKAGKVQFVLVNTDPRNEESIRALQKNLGLTMPVALDTTGRASRDFEIRGIPSMALLDGAGIVRWLQVGYGPGVAENLRQKIRKLLDEAPSK